MPDEPTEPDAASRWSDQLLGWGLPDWILEQAPESPWGHDVAPVRRRRHRRP
jgi:hypothetical protein